jgi:CDGSH-type Zn-finger protein
MAENNKMRVKVTKDGPYLVSGGVPISDQTIVMDEEGESVGWSEGEQKYEARETCGLCRCGVSKTKPYCDGTHKQTNFDGTETARNKKYEKAAEKIDGPQMQLWDQEELCAKTRHCYPNGGLWNSVKKTDKKNIKEEFSKQCGDCPSGRYAAFDKKTGKLIEPELPRSIGLVEDPGRDCSGPIWVRGGIPIESAKGEEYEIRNRYTLCRCGKSKNKPFCDGAHIAVKFRPKH